MRGSKQGKIRAAKTCGASLLALSVMGVAQAASAQPAPAAPGSVQCPRNGAIVTCTGDLEAGFRSADDATMRELRIRELTKPITRVVEVRANSDMIIDIAQGTVINATNPRGTLRSLSNLPNESAVSLLASTTRNMNWTLRNGADIAVTFATPPSNIFGGALLLDGGRNVDVVNTGRLNVNLEGGGSADVIDIIRADRVTLANSGALSLNGAGSASGSIFNIEARDITITNSAPLNLIRGSVFDVSVADYFNARTPGRIVINNSGEIRVQDASPSAGTRTLPQSEVRMAGVGGTISVTNSGAWTNSPMRIEASNGSTGDDFFLSFENEGALVNSGVFVSLPNRRVDQIFNDLDINDLLPDEANGSMINRGALTDSSLNLFIEARRVTASLTNSGTAVGRSAFSQTLSARAMADMTGSSTLTLTNSGNLTANEVTARAIGDNLVFLISAESSHSVGVLNTGILSAQTADNVSGIRVLQGRHTYSDEIAQTEEEYVFDLGATVTNRGAIQLGNVRDYSTGIEVARAYGDIVAINSAPITVVANSFRNLQNAGVSLQGYSDTQLTNSGAVTVSGNGAGASAGIAFFEVSLGDRVVQRQSGRLRGYDRAADLASRVTIETTADVTAGGLNDFGIFGFIGIVDDATIRRETGPGFDIGRNDPNSITAANDRAAATINIASGVTVTGGTGSGSGIGVQGVGSVTIANNGTILGQGNSGTGAIVLGDLLAPQSGDFIVFTPPARDPARFLNLVDTVNTGTIRSDAGYGIWAQNGAITNLINRGTIRGGQASISAARTSSVLNDVGGTIDGRLILGASGSSLQNRGILTATQGGFVTHELNGAYTQTGSGSLVLRTGPGGNDRFVIAGNAAIDGAITALGGSDADTPARLLAVGGNLTLAPGTILNLVLGAPSGTAMFDVGGNLVLDGIVNVAAGARFGDGIYRLFDYRGTLTDNGLAIGSVANGGRASVQTSVAGQVNLAIATNIIQFWDGANLTANGVVNGGNGTWNNSLTNWANANGTVNEAWLSSFAVFQGQSGTVTIAAEGVSAGGMQFAVDGYRIEGGSLTLTAPGTIRVGDGSAAGAGMTATIASTIMGSAGFDKTDLGTLILTGANTFTGGVRVSSGVLQIGGDNALGAAAGGLTLDGGTLRAAAAFTSGRPLTIGASGGTLDTGGNAITWSGQMGGAGTLAKTGAGTLTLSGNSAGFAGLTRVAAGTLSLTGTLGGAVDVVQGARLTGTGRLGTASLASGATLAPGTGGVGTLSTNGNVTFGSGSIFEVEVDPSGASDVLSVGGAVNLAGSVRAIFLGNQSAQCGGAIRSTILTAQGGINGTFGGVTANFAFLTPSLSYDANSVALTLTRNAATFSERGATANQRGSAGAAEALGCGNQVFNAIVPLTADQARSAFDQLSGEIHASTREALLDDSRFVREALLERRPDGRGAWLSGHGAWGEIEGDGNAAVLDRESRGLLGGVDLPIGDAWSAGIGGGYSQSDFHLGGRASRAEIESWHAGVRLSGRFGPLDVTVGGALSWHEVQTARTIVFPGLMQSATTSYDARTSQVFAEAGHVLPLGRAAIEPFAGVAWVGIQSDGFTEAGGTAALRGSAGSAETFASTLGLRGRVEIGALSLKGKVAWQHDFDADPSRAILAFDTAPGTRFTVTGVTGDEDVGVIELGAETRLAGAARLSLVYSGRIGARSEDHGARATLSLPF